MTTVGKAIATGVVALGALGVRTYVVGRAASVAVPTASAASSLAHFDHTPRHGGLVLMNGDIHFEVVLGADGRSSVYFTDAVRAPLPASVASRVSLVVTAPDRAGQTTELRRDATDARWTGQGSPIADPDAIVRITYAAATPYWIDVPVSAWPQVIAALPPR